MLLVGDSKRLCNVEQKFRQCLIGNKIGFFSEREAGECYFDDVSFADLRRRTRESNAQDVPILPIAYGEHRFVLAHYEELRAKGYIPYINSRTVLDICHKKDSFVQYVKSIGMEKLLPETLSFSDAVDVVDKKYPIIAKPITGVFGKRTFLFHSKEELKVFALGNEDTYLFQKYIGGQNEYAFHFVAEDGCIRFLASFEHKHFNSEYVQGIGEDDYQTDECPISIQTIKDFANLLSRMEYRGFGCIDFKYDNHEQAKIFEINPRLGASLGIRPKLFSTAITAYCKCCYENEF